MKTQSMRSLRLSYTQRGRYTCIYSPPCDTKYSQIVQCAALHVCLLCVFWAVGVDNLLYRILCSVVVFYFFSFCDALYIHIWVYSLLFLLFCDALYSHEPVVLVSATSSGLIVCWCMSSGSSNTGQESSTSASRKSWVFRHTSLCFSKSIISASYCTSACSYIHFL